MVLQKPTLAGRRAGNRNVCVLVNPAWSALKEGGSRPLMACKPPLLIPQLLLHKSLKKLV
jgi:hypothetical protein